MAKFLSVPHKARHGEISFRATQSKAKKVFRYKPTGV